MALKRPFPSAERLFQAARGVWEELGPSDWLEAFSHHPKIGDRKSLRAKFTATREWAQTEQAGAQGASEKILDELAEGNRLYEQKFGFIFIVCATGKSAGEMLKLLQERLKNDPQRELAAAAEEQGKITFLRLEKLLKG